MKKKKTTKSLKKWKDEGTVVGYRWTPETLWQGIKTPPLNKKKRKESLANPTSKNKEIDKNSKIIRYANDNVDIRIYADGACFPNPGGPGGYGTVVVFNDSSQEEYQGFSDSTTNNRMELLGILVGLESIEETLSEDIIEIVSDSMYSLNVLHKWKPKVNLDLINPIRTLLKKCKDYQLKWVRGHCECLVNKRADSLASGAVLLESSIEKEFIRQRISLWE